MRKTAVLFFLNLLIVSAQGLPDLPIIELFRFPPQLKAYLELTDAQVTAITKANTDLDVFRTRKLQRQAQVQMELSIETAKQTVDPMALGLRYAEVEVIKREISAEQQKTATAVQNVLTAPQKTKLAVLQQSLQLYSLACVAVDQNVLNMPSQPGNIIPANRIEPTDTPIASLILGRLTTPLCSGLTNIPIRTGGFTFSPLLP